MCWFVNVEYTENIVVNYVVDGLYILYMKEVFKGHMVITKVVPIHLVDRIQMDLLNFKKCIFQWELWIARHQSCRSVPTGVSWWFLATLGNWLRYRLLFGVCSFCCVAILLVRWFVSLQVLYEIITYHVRAFSIWVLIGSLLFLIFTTIEHLLHRYLQALYFILSVTYNLLFSYKKIS